ncbi:hypothetical protein M378DRAFT_18934 [Amanita muscaria Koide BX008]|uniref:Uncharacterized protein n=1 Tax=Amanita muscaria (strain Koide BX008) TaxID=946122 RepID=A0A0C2VZW3_AMAMK|nr:hypothetical protein M378DRAFT_18934 [Amanita muscaria Koide BX008]
MSRRECDQRAQGLDYYPESSDVKNQQAPGKAEDAPTGNGTKHNTAASSAQKKKREQAQRNRTVKDHRIILESTINTLFAKNAPRLEGEAVNPDGTLKDANEITWVHSPSDPTPSLLAPPPEKRVLDDVAEDELEGARLKRVKRRRLHSAETVHEEDDDLYTGNDGIYVNDEADVHKDESDNDEGGGVTESEDDDPEARNRYLGCVVMCSVYSEVEPLTMHDSSSRRTLVLSPTRKVLRKGLANTVSALKADAFFTGNISALRTHITRFHYDVYLNLCKAKEVEPKAHAPEDWGKKKSQQRMDSFVVAIKKVAPVPPVTKSGLKEFLLELIVVADLFFFTTSLSILLSASFLCLVHYLCPKFPITEVPKRTCIGDAVLAKAERLDEIDRNLAKSISSLVSIVYDGWSSEWRHPLIIPNAVGPLSAASTGLVVALTLFPLVRGLEKAVILVKSEYQRTKPTK